MGQKEGSPPVDQSLTFDQKKRFLSLLGENEPPPTGYELAHPAVMAAWLSSHDLGACAYIYSCRFLPELAAALQGDFFLATGAQKIRFELLDNLLTKLSEKKIEVVLLKGAALALSVYDSTAQRTMSDIDIWVNSTEFERVVNLLTQAGYRRVVDPLRPPALQQMANGEIFFHVPGRLESDLEIHWSAFPGWWLKIAARVDHQLVWSRKERLNLANGGAAFQLAAEDTIIELASHLVINHQFGLAALRSLLDLHRTIQKRRVDWDQLVVDAKKWRLSYSVWIALQQVEAIFGLDEPGRSALELLKPSRFRRWWLKRLVSPRTIFDGRDLQQTRLRYLFLVLITDRSRSILDLFLQTVWPSDQWLRARYGSEQSRLRHLANLFVGKKV